MNVSSWKTGGACNYLVLTTASCNPCVWSDRFGDALIVWRFFPSILLHVLFYDQLLVKILLTKKSSMKSYSKGSTRGWDKRNQVSALHKALLQIVHGMYHRGGSGGSICLSPGWDSLWDGPLLRGVQDSPSFKHQSSPRWHQFQHKHVKLCPGYQKPKDYW
jgi:hypothetical protein